MLQGFQKEEKENQSKGNYQRNYTKFPIAKMTQIEVACCRVTEMNGKRPCNMMHHHEIWNKDKQKLLKSSKVGGRDRWLERNEN